MSIQSLPAKQIFKFIVDDFQSAWNALVARKGIHKGGGNFMFALLSMILLEFACRICRGDPSGKKIRDFTRALTRIEPRYFTPLPGSRKPPRDFVLPGVNPDCHLLGMLFDLVRNGKAHQYQSPIVSLGPCSVDIGITGAASKRGLKHRGNRRLKRHLGYKLSSNGDLTLYVRTDQLFLDLKRAITASKIISDADHVTDISRVWGSVTVSELEHALISGGHTRLAR